MKINSNHELITITILMLVIGISIMGIVKITNPHTYNEITGKVATRLNITATLPIPCNFTLYQGANLISLPCIGDFIDLNETVQNITNLEHIFGYEKSQSDKWKVYNPSLPSWVINDLTFFTRKNGYWFIMNQTEIFFKDGFDPSIVQIPITAGYNLVGYPKNAIQPIATAFATINGSYTKVVGFDPVNKTYQTYIVGLNGTLNETRTYRGYWLNATGTDTWVVS